MGGTTSPDIAERERETILAREVPRRRAEDKKNNTAVSMSLAFHKILDSKGAGDVCKMEAVAVGGRRRGRVESD